jgi:hypothetical protein
MDVAAYLKELLYQERVVHVPGLGTFLTRKSAGVYNHELHQFNPPKNSIDFVEEEKQDEALENYISLNKNISTTAARYFIDKFVEKLKTEAATKNIAVKEVLFPAEEEVKSGLAVQAYNMENFGLPPVSLSIPKKIIAQEENEPESKENQVDTFYQEFSNSSIETETQPKRNTGFWASVFLLLTVGVLGCCALYFYYPNLFNRFAETKPAVRTAARPVTDTLAKQTIAPPQTTPDTTATKVATDTAKTEVAKPVTSPLPKAENKPKSPADNSTIVAATTSADPDFITKSPYEIIGASFKKKGCTVRKY